MKKFIKKLLREYYDDFDGLSDFNDDDFYEPKKKKTSFINELPDIIRLYRILVADSEESIDKQFPGFHYSMDKKNLLKTHSFLKGKNYFLVTVDAPKKLIDTKTTLENNGLEIE